MICYLCNKELLWGEELSKDHVPQSGFFLTGDPKRTITLKTHRKCNEDFKLDEDYVIDLISATSAGFNIQAQKIWKQKRLPSLIHPKKIKFLNRLVKYETQWVDGLPKTLIGLERLVKVLNKIVRGLYFKEFKRTIESDKFEIVLNEFLSKQELKGWNVENPDISIGNLGNEEFKCLKRRTNMSLEYNLFFYGTHYFRLVYSKNELS